MNPLYLEVLVVLLGILLLIAEAFSGAGAKRGIAYAGIAGLTGILAATFFIDPAAINAAAPYARFYSADALAIFLKQFALLAAIVVLVMSLEYAPTVEANMPSERRGAGLCGCRKGRRSGVPDARGVRSESSRNTGELGTVLDRELFVSAVAGIVLGFDWRQSS